MPGSEAVSRDRATLLAIENAGDDAIGMMDGKTADEVDGFFIGSPRRWGWSVAGRLRNRVMSALRQRTARRARYSAGSTAMVTSSSKVRSSSLRSRSVVVGAVHTRCKSPPSASRL